MQEKIGVWTDVRPLAKDEESADQQMTSLFFDAHTIAMLRTANPKFKQKRIYSFTKRICDFTASLLGIIVLSPLLIAIALIVKGGDGGSVFFKQKRIGENGKEFTMYKFRSMVPNADSMLAELQNKNEASWPMFKMKDDPRVTKVGRFIRKTSLDELPQLFNVLNNSMSLVGPRPALPQEVSKYTMKQAGRLLVKPGITCIWQVSGRSQVPFEKQVEMDAYYVEHHGVWLDTKLLFQTVPAVLSHKGAE